MSVASSSLGARTATYWDRLDYVLLVSFFGRQKFLLQEISKPMRSKSGTMTIQIRLRRSG